MPVTPYGRTFAYDDFLAELSAYASGVEIPVVTLMAMQGQEPYKVLFTTMLSARTKDQVTLEAARRLFAAAPTLPKLSELSEDALAKLIYPVGFYLTKARAIKKTAALLLKDHGGDVPRTIESLITLPGVGRKTATLVVAECFGTQAICVDTHVHRISNRLGLVRTRTPVETERNLEQIVPRRLWRTWNPLLVAYGQTLCTPISPKCSQCVVKKFCKRAGVVSSR